MVLLSDDESQCTWSSHYAELCPCTRMTAWKITSDKTKCDKTTWTNQRTHFEEASCRHTGNHLNDDNNQIQ